MDALFELLSKYNCHLHRDSISMERFLEDNYKQYILDLENSIDPQHNLISGSEMCDMVKMELPNIRRYCNEIVKIFSLHSQGRVVDAANMAFDVFDDMKPQLMFFYSGNFRHENYYRIRSIDKDGFELDRKELFHIPLSKRHLVKTERYSLAGHPCLYLCSQMELNWYECGKPEKFAIAQFSVPQEESYHYKFIDFSEKLMPLANSFFCWFHNETDKESVRKYLLKYICTYPLRAACSVSTSYPDGGFKEEYILSQFLIQWLVIDGEFDGIRYESSSPDETVYPFCGHNLVLVTSDFDSNGYDKKLRRDVTVGTPIIINTQEILISEEDKAKEIASGNFPFRFDETKIPGDFAQI